MPSETSIGTIRKRWITLARIQADKGQRAMLVSPQALLLVHDLELAFCAGAWASVIVMSHAAIEAAIRQTSTKDHAAMCARLFGNDPDLHWLRALRNELVHVAGPTPPSSVWKLSGGTIVEVQATLEPHARRAVELMYRELFRAGQN